MSNFVNALQTFTPTQAGEKGHVEKTWSFNIDEKITQFFFQLVRSEDHSDLERHLHDILGKLKSDLSVSQNTATMKHLTTMYKLIGQTRDLVMGKGEQQLAFMQIFVWWQYFPELAANAFIHFVKSSEHPYGSWKDIKYCAKFIKDKTSDSEHPLIIHICKLLCGQLNADWTKYQNYKANPEEVEPILSLAARWCPREPNYKKKKNTKFGFIYQTIAYEMFPEFLSSTTPDSPVSWRSAKRKCKIHLRKRLSTLNGYLDTTQIKQCGDNWSKIDFNTVTTQTMRKQKRSFQNLTKRDLQKSEKDDRIQCSQNFKNHIEAAKADPSSHKVHGKRCNTYELVKDAMQHLYRTPQSETDIDTLNLQWQDNLKNNKGLGKLPIVAMADTSGSMECDGSVPLYNSIGLSIRCAELTHPAFKNQVLIFDHEPQWCDLSDCPDVWSKVWKLKRASWGTSTKLYKAFKMVLDACIKNKVPPEEVQSMIIAIFSDMQIDCEQVQENPWSDQVLADEIEAMYAKYGYSSPHLLFWNLRKTSGFPTLSSKNNCTMLSGYNSTLLNVFCDKGIDVLKEFTPRRMLDDLLGNPRYAVMEEDLISYFN
jgi:hypothetical protein